MKNSVRVLFLVMVVGVVMFSYSAVAQQRYGIAAMVNDEAITTIAVKNRLQLAIASSGLENAPEVRAKLLPQVVQLLIDEALLEQEAATRGISISAAELGQAMASIAAKNNITPEQLPAFFASQSIAESAVRAQVRAQIVKTRLMSRAVKPQVSVTDQEIEEKMENIASQAGKEEFHISEIVLPVDTPEDEDKITKLAEQLYAELHSGKNFASVAREFSRSNTAEKGGELGWIVEDALSNMLRTQISGLKGGEISKPLRLADGYHILRLNDRRAIVTTATEETEIGMRQLFVPMVTEGEAAEKQKLFEKLENARAELRGCGVFEQIAESVGSTASPQMVMTQLKDVKEEVRKVLAALPVGMPSPIIESEKGGHVFMICERIEATESFVQPERVRAMLEQQEMGLYFRRFVQDLRRDAFVEIRL